MTEKVSPEEFNKLLFKGRGKTNEVFKKLIALQVGEAIKIPFGEWKKRYKISRIKNYIRKNYGYEFAGGRLADGSGWAYKREK